MLINCPECNKSISDKAHICPSCGYPVKSMPINTEVVYEPKKRTKRSFQRLPNGYGSIKELKGKRRKPYAAYLPVTEYNINGSPVSPKALGYFETRTAAMEALAEYHKYNQPGISVSITFMECYEKFFYDKYVVQKHRHYSKDAKNAAKLAYKYSSALNNYKIRDISPSMLQKTLDEAVSYNVAKYMIVLFRGMFQFAMNNDWIIRDPSASLVNHHKNEVEEVKPFTQDEIDILWQHSDDRDVQMILIMIYSGMRITEYTNLKIENGCFIGGSKTNSGRDRIVPIHSAIAPFIDDKLNDYINGIGSNAIRVRYYKTLERCGITKDRNPHSTRHTFSWLCDKCKMDEMCKHLIMGHSLGKDVEIATYGHRTIDELKQAIELISV